MTDHDVALSVPEILALYVHSLLIISPRPVPAKSLSLALTVLLATAALDVHGVDDNPDNDAC